MIFIGRWQTDHDIQESIKWWQCCTNEIVVGPKCLLPSDKLECIELEKMGVKKNGWHKKSLRLYETDHTIIQ